MNKYIDADETIIAVVKATTYGDALRAVREQPSIGIVLCKDCKYRYQDTCLINPTQLWEADDFCSYGERRE